MYRELEVLVEAGEQAVEDAYHDGRHDESEADPHRGRRQRIGRALEDEHLHQVAALGADRPCHAHLRTSGRRPHDEYQEYEQYPYRDREQAEEYEERGDEAASLVRLVQAPALDFDDVELGQVLEQGRRLQNDLFELLFGFDGVEQYLDDVAVAQGVDQVFGPLLGLQAFA